MQFFISTLAITSLVSAGSGSGSGGGNLMDEHWIPPSSWTPSFPSGGHNGPWRPPTGPSNPPIVIPSFPSGGNNGPWPPTGPSNPPIEIPSFPSGGNNGPWPPTGPSNPPIEIPSFPGGGNGGGGNFPKNQVSFGKVTHGGSGCRQGSVSQNFNADRTAFTLLFDSYVASIGGPLGSQTRKNCQLNLQINVPSGWQYSLATIDYRGYAQLDSGVRAEQSAIYYFQGERRQTTLVTEFNGPVAQSYTIRNTFPVNTNNWSPCRGSANLNINSAISLSAPINQRATGLLTTDSIDGQVKVYQQFGLVWRRC